MQRFLLVLTFVSLSLFAGGKNRYKGVMYADHAPVELAPVRLPELPVSLSFAGESVPLKYRDVRESLTDELAVTLYSHSRTLKTLLRTKRYFEMIEPILEKNGIPSDFKYLAMAESGLDPDIASPAGAMGLWQFLKGTAAIYGLQVNDDIDERCQVEKATQAACDYLKKSYERFGSWTLAAASYNVGPNGLERRMKSQLADNYYDLLLPDETMRYLFRILCLKMVAEDPARYGFDLDEAEYYPPYRYEEVTVSDPLLNWSEIAKSYGTNYKRLRELNPWIRRYEYKNPDGKPFVLKIPKGRD